MINFVSDMAEKVRFKKKRIFSNFKRLLLTSSGDIYFIKILRLQIF
mgnify:CR=1 FL=1